jgi:hypothetical protein
MDYLKQHLQASVPALFAVSRYLSTRPDGVDESDLRRALRPPAMFEGRPGEAALQISLEVGADIGLLTATGARGERTWALAPDARDEVAGCPCDESSAFRSLVLRLLGARAVAALDRGEPPSDVALALTWLVLRQDPRTPLADAWDDGPERALKKALGDRTVGGPDQWRGLRRWGRSLGVLTEVQTGPSRARMRVTVDPTTAVRGVLPLLPARAPAGEWLDRLRTLVPVLGAPALAAAVDVRDGNVPLALALALRKLDRAGHLRLVTSDDDRGAVTLQVGGEVAQRVAEIRVAATVGIAPTVLGVTA